MFKSLISDRESQSSVPAIERPEEVKEVEGNGCSDIGGCGGCYGDDSRSDAVLCRGLMMVYLL